MGQFSVQIVGHIWMQIDTLCQLFELASGRHIKYSVVPALGARLAGRLSTVQVTAYGVLRASPGLYVPLALGPF